MNVHIKNAADVDMSTILQEFIEYFPSGVSSDRRSYLIQNFPSKVAFLKNKIVGFIYTSPSAPDILEISNIFVLENRRGMGIGGKLISCIECEAKKNKYKVLIAFNSELYNTNKKKKDPSYFYNMNGFKKLFSTQNTNIFLKEI